jgi:ComEC/Rec2-related protein
MILRSGDIVFLSAIGFLAGLLEANFPWHLSPVAILLAPGVLLILRFTFLRSSRSAIFGTVAVVSAFSLALFYFHFFVLLRNAEERLPDQTAPFRVFVAGDPSVSDRYVSFPAKLMVPFAGAVSVFAPPGSAVRYGDILALTGTLVSSRSPGGVPAVFPKSIVTVSLGNGPWPMQILHDVKRAILERFSSVLPGDDAALIGGMTVGGTTGISARLKDEMTASETLYVASMYGYKIAAIVSFVMTALGDRVSRRIRSWIAAAAGSGFVLLSGATLSAVRGGIAAGILLLARGTGNLVSRRNGLAFAAAGMALADPTMVGQMSFLFSFLSVAGMAFLVEPLRNFLRIGGGRGIFLWKEAVLFGVASLLPLIPLISVSFGSFSLSAIVANILIAPAIPVGMALGTALAAATLVSWHLAVVVAQAVEAFLVYPFAIIRFFAVQVVPLPFSFDGASSWAIYYLLLAGFIYRYRKRPTLRPEMQEPTHLA